MGVGVYECEKAQLFTYSKQNLNIQITVSTYKLISIFLMCRTGVVTVNCGFAFALILPQCQGIKGGNSDGESDAFYYVDAIKIQL